MTLFVIGQRLYVLEHVPIFIFPIAVDKVGRDINNAIVKVDTSECVFVYFRNSWGPHNQFLQVDASEKHTVADFFERLRQIGRFQPWAAEKRTKSVRLFGPVFETNTFQLAAVRTEERTCDKCRVNSQRRKPATLESPFINSCCGFNVDVST